MKLYTEEQIINSMLSMKTYIEMYDESVIDKIVENHIKALGGVELPSDEEIWRWWQTQKFQKEQGEQEYTMLYEIDLPKILKAFIEHFSKLQGGNK